MRLLSLVYFAVLTRNNGRDLVLGPHLGVATDIDNAQVHAIRVDNHAGDDVA